MCEAVSHTMPWVQIVILSGYDDFAYAQQAISLGVKEYLLKPVSAQELLEVLERIAGRIREDRRQQADLLRIKRQLASSSAFLREKLLCEALGGVRGEENVQSLLERARALNLSLLARRYLVILACPRGGEEGRTLAQSALYRLADGSGDAVHACEAQGGFALIVLGDSDEDLEERAYGFAQAALYEVERATGKSARMCIGEAVDSLAELPRSLQSAQRVRRAMELSADAEKRRIMGVRDMDALPPAAPAINLDVSPLSERLQYANREDVEGILKRLHRLHGLGGHPFGDDGQLSLCGDPHGRQPHHQGKRRRAPRGHRRQALGGQPLFRRARAGGGHPPGARSAGKGHRLPRGAVLHALQRRHQQGPRLSGPRISEQRRDPQRRFQPCVHVQQPLLHHLFPGDGRDVYRIPHRTAHEPAKELLRTTQMRSSDIAYAVGYNDPHYFSYLFKKHTGMTPRDFRKEAQGT